MKNLTVQLISVTIRQKESNTHTKFIFTSNGKPFPTENFDLAREWMEQGLLDDESTAFIKKIIDGPVFFRGRLEVMK